MEVQGKTDQEYGPKAEKDKTEIVAGQSRRTKEDIQKRGIKLKAPRFQKEGDIRIAGLRLGKQKKKKDGDDDDENEQFLYSANLNINELNAHVTQHSQTYTHEQKMTK